ncbi:MAG: VOC family protein [Nitrospirota bacterium]
MLIQSIGVHIKVSDFAKSKVFYETLGFTKVFEYGPDKTFQKDEKGNLISATEAYHGITFSCGGARLEIADGHRAVKPEVFRESICSSKVSLMVNIEKISDLLKVCKEANIPPVVGPRHYYWGTLEVVIKDPDGFVLVFIAPYSEEEAIAISADETFGQPPKL